MTEPNSSTEKGLCQVCGESIGDDRVYCARCHAPHHRDCWDFNGGCSIFACGGRECWRSDPRGDSAGQVVYIEEHTAAPDPPPGPERRSAGRSWSIDGRFLWVLSVLALYVLKGIEADMRSTQRSRVATRPGVRATRAAQRHTPPVPRLLGEARTSADITTGDGKVVIRRGVAVRVFEADPDGRHRIEAPGPEVRWVLPSYLTEIPIRQHVPRSVLALAQLVNGAQGLARGEIVQIVGESTRVLPQLAVNIRSKVYDGLTSGGRLVRGISPNDIALIERPAAGQVPLDTDLGPKAMLDRLRLQPARHSYMILVEPAVSGGASLEAGSFLELTGVETSQGEPSFYRGRTRSGDVRVHASFCRPALARELAREASRSLGQSN